MDNPVPDGDDDFDDLGDEEFAEIDDEDFVELMSIEDEKPTLDARWRNEPDARFYFRKEETTVDISVPSGSTFHFFEVVTALSIIAAATFAPVMTLKAMPEDLPTWVAACVIALQLTIVILVAVKTFFKPGPSGPTGRLSG